MVDAVNYANKLNSCPCPKPQVAFKGEQVPVDMEQKPDTFEKDVKNNKIYPIKSAVLGGLLLGGIEIGTDFLLRKFTKLDMYPKKISFIVGGLTALIGGVFTYFNAKKIQKNDNIKNYEDLFNSQINK